MKRRHFRMTFVLAALLGAGSFSFSAFAQSAAGVYEVDATHSSVVFRAQHLGVSYVYGRFNQFSGKIDYRPDKPGDTSFDVSIETESVDTGNERRDQHLRSPDFFNAKQFPVIRFQSKKVESAGENRLKVSGELTLHGKTRPVTTEIELVGHGDRGQRFGYRAGWHAEFAIQRSDFGMDFMLEGVGDEVKILVSLEGKKQ